MRCCFTTANESDVISTESSSSFEDIWLHWISTFSINGNSFYDNLHAQKCIMLELALTMDIFLFRLT